MIETVPSTKLPISETAKFCRPMQKWINYTIVYRHINSCTYRTIWRNPSKITHIMCHWLPILNIRTGSSGPSAPSLFVDLRAQCFCNYLVIFTDLSTYLLWLFVFVLFDHFCYFYINVISLFGVWWWIGCQKQYVVLFFL